MFAFDQLAIPVVVAPMAGGPTTPQLVAAVANAGGSGFLAVGGGVPAAELAETVAETMALTTQPFGVNLFVPDDDQGDPADLRTYREVLRPDAARYGIDLPETETPARSYWREDIGWLVANPVAFVSFTFGCPSADEIARLTTAGTLVVITVTNEAEAKHAVSLGAGVLCVQGPEAGGHRSTHHLRDVPDQRDVLTLLCAIRAAVDVPLIVAGGITRPEQVRAMIDAGASAVQCGTVFLRSPECGANPIYKDALASGAFTETQPARAFSGRFARSLVNRFVRDHRDAAPAVYPGVNRLTGPIRQAAASANDPDGMSLWSGTGFHDAPDAPAADIARSLWPEVRR